MFNVEKSIQTWRKRLEKHPGLEPGYIEELESHLRDKIDDLVEKGYSEKEAFHQAVENHLDDPEEIAGQFFQARKTKLAPPPWKSKSGFSILLPNFMKISFRNIRRKKAYAFINIFGLAIGLAACLLMVLYINFELSFDQFHSNKERIYRVDTYMYTDGSGIPGRNVTNGWPVGLILESDFPEIEKVVFMRQWPQYSIKHNNQFFFENTLLADQNFLDVFDFNMINGNSGAALSKPGQIVITEEMETKFFGEESALGQFLILEDSVQYEVTGVMENVPANSHIQFDVLISFASWSSRQSEFNTNSHWLDVNMRNYVLLREGADTEATNEKIKDIYMAGAGDYFEGLGMTPKVRLEPMQDIYLYSFGNGLGPKSDINYLYLLGGIAVFILLIACINFMNLSTARSIERAREVGVRKVIGSTRKTLIAQFLTESTLMCVMGMITAILFAYWALPWFNELTGNSFQTSDLISTQMFITLLLFVGVVGLLAGLYPAFILSDFKPVQVLKDGFTTSGKGAAFRKTLVVFQFAISCFLIICTLVIVKQLRFMQNQNLGFEKEKILVMDVRRAQDMTYEVNDGSDRYQLVENKLLRNPNIMEVSSALAVPGRSGWRSILVYGEGQTADQRFSIEYLPVDYDYLEMFGIELIAGRNFSEERSTDLNGGVIINESAVRQFGWETPENALGKNVITINSLLDTPVIGVVKDYHHHGLQEQVQPLVMVVRPGFFSYYAIKFNSENTSDVIDHMRSAWEDFFPGYTFEYFFLEEEYERQYAQEKQLAMVYGTFSTFAILIACLGLFGLTAFATAKRRREIGIRKVLGASIPNIFLLISKDFLLLIGLAFVLASPAAYWFMSQWLKDFAFRTNIGMDVFAITAFLGLMITIVTISWQSVKAALINPVQSLKNE